MNKILIIAEHNGIEINSSTSKCVSCAANIPDSQIDIAVFAKNGDELANQASKICNTNKVIHFPKKYGELYIGEVRNQQEYGLGLNARYVVKDYVLEFINTNDAPV